MRGIPVNRRTSILLWGAAVDRPGSLFWPAPTRWSQVLSRQIFDAGNAFRMTGRLREPTGANRLYAQ